MSRSLFSWLSAAVVAATLLPACGNKPAVPPGPPAPPPGSTGPAELWKEFSGTKAFAEVEKQVAFGPRPAGSDALEKARGHLTSTLAAHGWEVERQAFRVAPVKTGTRIDYVNVIARFPATPGQPAARTTQRIIVGSHYDTKFMPGQNFVGANDAGSSTGALLELARVLATAPALAQQVELVFFDGEEAMVEFDPDPVNGVDGLVGSRHYASSLLADGRARQFRCAIVLDMMGDKNLGLTIPNDSPPPLLADIYATAEQLGFGASLGERMSTVYDDHQPIIHIAHIPAIDLIDFDYPPWHTGEDTLDKLSPESLRIVGQMTVVFLQRQLAK